MLITLYLHLIPIPMFFPISFSPVPPSNMRFPGPLLSDLPLSATARALPWLAESCPRRGAACRRGLSGARRVLATARRVLEAENDPFCCWRSVEFPETKSKSPFCCWRSVAGSWSNPVSIDGEEAQQQLLRHLRGFKSCINLLNEYSPLLKSLNTVCKSHYSKLDDLLAKKRKADQQINWRVMQNVELKALKERLTYLKKKLAEDKAKVSKESNDLKLKYGSLELAFSIVR
ncbi:hypothetical protein ZIOFF_030188 [Zingiber officinale]|uniref:Uncharacterized protein n=1 Tax=Zingiber officinale TaxID=94328 RepID=A0A8J5GZJ3_ZINOF|nr:hypothetical protein ZIOFF_067055 [Zingiber officinale]KAG6512094.1 hypothetical protein ZIOFF_030188 [Zingiber officinale]